MRLSPFSVFFLLLLVAACLSTVSAIPHCLVMSQQGSCELCEENYELSFNNQECERKSLRSETMGVLEPRRLQSCGANEPFCRVCNMSLGNTTFMNTSNSSGCIECLPTFQLLDNGTCECTPPGIIFNNSCVSCNVGDCVQCQLSDICFRCQHSFQLIVANNLCISCNITDCLQCSNPDFCKTCNDTLQPSADGTSCVPFCPFGQHFAVDTITCVNCSLEGCVICSSNQICSRCNTGYTLAANGSCIFCYSPFATCDANGIGQTCITPSYSLNPASNGRCFRCAVSHCRICSQSNTSQCVTCQTGYTLNASTRRCVPDCNVVNCATCAVGVQSFCNVCNRFYVAQGGSCNSCSDIPKCVRCSATTSGSCTECNNGYFLRNGECMACPFFCSHCTSSTRCTALKRTHGRAIFNSGRQLAVCDSGCQLCPSGNIQSCSQCVKGHALTANRKCMPCVFPCATCMTTNASACLSCLQGTHFNQAANTCIRCNSSCNTCQSNNPNICSSCPLGIALINGVCSGRCIQNCLVCDSLSTCLQCRDGYTVDPTGKCVPCLERCKRCPGTQVSICLECGTGLILNQISGLCESCPLNCKQCSISADNTYCLQCNPSYDLTSSFTCQKQCTPPCASCDDNNPGICFSCIAGYNHNPASQKCTGIISCAGGCTVCPLGYTLSSGVCLQCEGDCARCDSNTRGMCTSCYDGKYVSSSGSTCETCPVGCSTCTNDKVCDTCSDGYTLLDNPAPSTQTCVACTLPCITCLGDPKQCNSCANGATLVGWTCQTYYNLGFKSQLDYPFDQFYVNYGRYLQAISDASKSSSVSNVTMKTLVSGSVDNSGNVSMAYNTNDVSGATIAFLSLQSALASNNMIAGMRIISSQINVNGGPTDSGVDRNLALILAISIPLTFLLILLVVICGFYHRSRSSRYQMNEHVNVILKDDSMSSKSMDGYNIQKSYTPFQKNVAPI